jgi:IS5 family transposase
MTREQTMRAHQKLLERMRGSLIERRVFRHKGNCEKCASIKQIHERIVGIAKEKDIAQGSKMRVDTTAVETNIHYPTDSSLLGDGVRVLTPS